MGCCESKVKVENYYKEDDKHKEKSEKDNINNVPKNGNNNHYNNYASTNKPFKSKHEDHGKGPSSAQRSPDVPKKERDKKVYSVYKTPPANLCVIAQHPDPAQLTPRPRKRRTEISRPTTSWLPHTLTSDVLMEEGQSERPHTSWQDGKSLNSCETTPRHLVVYDGGGSDYTETYYTNVDRSVNNIDMSIQQSSIDERNEAKLTVICHRYTRKKPRGYLLKRQKIIAQERLAKQFKGYAISGSTRPLSRQSHRTVIE